MLLALAQLGRIQALDQFDDAFGGIVLDADEYGEAGGIAVMHPSAHGTRRGHRSKTTN